MKFWIVIVDNKLSHLVRAETEDQAIETVRAEGFRFAEHKMQYSAVYADEVMIDGPVTVIREWWDDD